MNPLFLLHLIGFVVSILVLTRWVNALCARAGLAAAYLPSLSWGWCCYLFVYLIGRRLGVPTDWTRYALAALTVTVLVAAVLMWLRRPGKARALRLPSAPGGWVAAVAVSVFFAASVYVGPYLEYPSDPVEYLTRVQAWERVRDSVYDVSNTSGRFAPFAYHWLLRGSDIALGDRSGLALLSAAMQAMLLWAVIRLGAVLTGSLGWGCLGGLLSLGYLGYSAISYYRYLPLSGAVVAHVAFLEGLVLLVAALTREQWRYLLLLPPLVLLASWNHEQGIIFLGNALLGSGVLLLICRYRTFGARYARQLLLQTAGLATLTVAVATFLGWIPLRRPIDPLYVSELGSVFGLAIRVPSLAMMDDLLGLVGWSCMVLAAAVLVTRPVARELDIAAILSIWPLLVLWNPIALIFLGRVLPSESFHRLLYGSVFWLLPVVLLKHLSDRIRQSSRPQAAPLFTGLSVGVVLVLAALSFFSDPPLHGRMRHLWDRVDPRLDGGNLTRAIRFIREGASRECVDPHPDPGFLPIRRYVLTDPYVGAYLVATGYFYAPVGRWPEGPSSPLGFVLHRADGMEYASFRALLRERSVCYVVVYLQGAPLSSWLGATSRHWAPDVTRTEHYYAPRFLEWIRRHPEDFALVFRDGSLGVYRPR